MNRASAKVRPGIHIRDVEKELFSYLFMNKVATSIQIKRDVFKNVSHQYLYRRLNQLIQGKFISANYQKELRGRLVYSLHAKALAEYILPGAKDGIRRQSKSNSVLHDLELVDIYHRLQSLSCVENYYTENLLRSRVEMIDSEELSAFRGFNFDAVLRIKRQNGTFLVALEFERSLKYHGRYLSYFNKLYAKSEIPAVIFIAANDKIQSSLMQIEQKVLAERSPKIFYGLLDDVLLTGEQVLFQNQNGERMTLK